MNRFSYILVSSILLFSCHQKTPTGQKTENEDSLRLASATLAKTVGECSSGPCLEISLTYPIVESGPSGLKKNVATWSKDFLISLLDPSLELDDETSLNSAMEGMIGQFRELTYDSVQIRDHFKIIVSDTILLQNEKHLTFRLDANIFMRSIPPYSTSAVATFDLATGKRLQPIDLVKDLEKLYMEAENRFRETQKEAFDYGFDFDESWPFVLAENVGLTTEGLFFCYVPYEVAPYVLGFTEFVIPYEQLEKL